MASDFRLKEQLPSVTAKILASYSDHDRINHLGHCPLPKYQVVVSILEDLKGIIYPGFRRRELAVRLRQHRWYGKTGYG